MIDSFREMDRESQDAVIKCRERVLARGVLASPQEVVDVTAKVARAAVAITGSDELALALMDRYNKMRPGRPPYPGHWESAAEAREFIDYVREWRDDEFVDRLVVVEESARVFRIVDPLGEED